MIGRLFILFVLCLFVTDSLSGQDTLVFSDSQVLYRLIEDGDTLYLSSIEEVHIFQHPVFKNKRDWRRYDRMVRNVKKVYPYAKMAGAEYDSLSKELMALKTDKERRQYINSVEDRIMDDYEEDLKKLTVTQGRILLKLIDRETGETSYELLQELKGKFNAAFWQTLARIFGHNLKSEFDPQGEDKLLNEIMVLLENGQL